MIYFIDVQGTLIDDKDKKPIPGAIEFINDLNSRKIPYIVVTNNTKRDSIDFINYLNNIGFNLNEKNYIDPLMILNEIIKEKNIAVYGTEEFLKIVDTLGYKKDFKNPEAVLVSIKDDYKFDEFAQIIDFLLNGAKLYGMHKTAIYAKNSKRYPGVGAILEMLKFATKKEYKVIGKPSDIFFKKALDKLKKSIKKDISFKDITIISDDVIGDLIEAKNLGMKTVFVLSGKFRDEKEILPYLKKEEKPDMTVKSIGYIQKMGVI
ncbi:HAD-IIA family hydrolase [Nitrosophilus kaiyonis]|uniref:HAD-IIA family hydrolase n=1 Tax=Nitrosophilus kaiyonis TaxID=2930200 RepID=UPI00249123AB|nr:HAD-IIA family hydrolase [Nitrosophilus kaiyonis]